VATKRPGLVPRVVVLILATALLTGRTGRAQTTGGIGGRVVDPEGVALPGVPVEVSSPNLQGTRTAQTSNDGTYRIPFLPPGSYVVRAALPGFAGAERSAAVTLDATATVDLTLRILAEEQVLVSGRAPLLDSTATTTGTSYTHDVIKHLPVARNYAHVVQANPCVFSDRGVTQGRSLALSIYGATSAENQWVIDGVNTTNVLLGIQGKAINNEFVQEVQVMTGGYQAEYGGALGGVINVITKAGGNEFHGDAFAYYDSSALSAERVFVAGEDSPLSGMRLADYQRIDIGADLGGFILKDRLWFFGAYNRVEFPAKVSRYVASDLVDETMEFPLDGTENLYTGKLTWNVASGSTLVAAVLADPVANSGTGLADPRQGGGVGARDITNPDPSTWEASRSGGAADYGLRWNQVLGGAALVTLQAARHQDRYQLEATGRASEPRLEDWTCEGGTREEPCEIPPGPNFVTGGFGQLGGVGSNSASYRNQLRADAVLYLGAHEIGLGGGYQGARTNVAAFYSGGQWIRHYSEHGQDYYEHRFYARSPDDLSPSDQTARASTRELGFYLQDSWRAAPGLTINAGLRWDAEDVQNFDDESVLQTQQWQPRLGVVWDPWRDGATKVYAFAGRFAYALPTDLAARAWLDFVSARTFNFDPVGVAQDENVFGHETATVNRQSFGTPVDGDLNPFAQDELTVGIDRLLGQSLTLGLKGTYRRLSSAIEDRCDLDYSAPENNGSSCAITNPGSEGRWARGDFHSCDGLDEFNNCWNGMPMYPSPRMPEISRIYRGIELLARKSLSDGLWLQASFVFSSLRGNYDGMVAESGQTDPGINADFDYPAFTPNSYGRLYLDRPYSLRLDGFYATPFHLSVGLQAWLRSGAPLGTYGYFSWNYGSVRLVPRGSAGRLPMEWDANLTLEYPILFGPVTVTLQGYLYNLFNNQIPTGRDQDWSNQRPADYPDSLFDANQPQSNPYYGLTTERQEPRLFRAAVRVSF
jgi:hypothetical protein